MVWTRKIIPTFQNVSRVFISMSMRWSINWMSSSKVNSTGFGPTKTLTMFSIQKLHERKPWITNVLAYIFPWDNQGANKGPSLLALSGLPLGRWIWKHLENHDKMNFHTCISKALYINSSLKLPILKCKMLFFGM